MKKLLLILIVVGTLSTFFPKSAEASLLRLAADPSIYIGSNSDPWLRESWVTDDENFTLSVINDYKTKKNPYLNTIEDVYLVIAIKEATKDSGITINLNGDTLDEDSFVSYGKHPRIKKHGVFGPDTYYYNYYIGDLAAQEIFDLNISIDTAEYQFVHFDAYGDLVKKKNKKCGYKTIPITNPYSHDVTWEGDGVVPEPATLSLLGLGLFGLAGLRRKKS